MASQWPTSSAKAQASTVAVFKRPLSPSKIPSLQTRRSRPKAKVMDEDEYVDKVSKIIEKDFFPELENDPSHGRTKGKEPGMSLDKFMATHTSEDNASFEEIMEASQKKFRLTHSWMFKDDELKSLEMKQNELALPSIEQQARNSDDTGGANRPIEGWTYKNVNHVFYNPEGVPFTADEKIEMAKKQRQIVLENTRFSRNPWKADLQESSVKAGVHSRFEKDMGKVGVDGRELTSRGHETPSVGGFKLLRSMPSPMPGVEDSPMMTWGEVESTPYRLEGGETPLPMDTSGGGAPSFSIQEVPKRDQLAHRLAEKNAKFYRDKKSKAIEKARSNIRTPKVNLTTRVASMSPAAQRLATTKLGVRIGTDKALRASYTPSPARAKSDRISSSVRLRTGDGDSTKVGSETPRTPVISTRSGNDMSSLTDNLLNLPTSTTSASGRQSRSKASDFF